MNAEKMHDHARIRSRGVNALERQWLVSLQRLSSAGLDEIGERSIATACQSPTALDSLLRRLGANPAGELKRLLEECDASPQGLEQWLVAVECVYKWLDERARKAELGQVIGYISCCSAANPDSDLARTAEDMLRQYGMDRA
jgi:hypothetical protein